MEDDTLLVERLQAGDESAFESLVERYHGRLLRLALTFVRDRAIAEEVVQETWLAVIKGLPRFEGRSRLKTWVFSILVNRARSRGARERRMVAFSDMAGVDDDVARAVDPARFGADGRWKRAPAAWDDKTPEKVLQTSESLRLLQAAIDELPARQRAVVTLRDIEGLDSEEICNILDISETNQRVLLHRARSKLRAALEDLVDGSVNRADVS